jgi:hypothetical protein
LQVAALSKTSSTAEGQHLPSVKALKLAPGFLKDVTPSLLLLRRKRGAAALKFDFLRTNTGYVLSRAAMDRVCARVGDFLTHHWLSYWSDINMGHFLQALNITFVPLDGLYLRNYQAPGVKRIAPNLKDDAIIPELAVGQPLSNHWAGPDEMPRLHAAHGMGKLRPPVSKYPEAPTMQSFILPRTSAR